jgi:hypothetical protein
VFSKQTVVSGSIDPERVEGLGCNFVLFQEPMCNLAATLIYIYQKFQGTRATRTVGHQHLRAATGSHDIKHMGAKHKGEKILIHL